MNEDKLKKFFQRDRFAAYNGITLEKVEPGYAVTKMVVTENHLNGVDIIQGGAIFTLADLAFAAAANSYGQVTVGINANISYFKASSGKILMAEAKEVSSSSKIANYNVDVFNEKHELIARLTLMGYKKDKPIEFE
ncbi:PaaI family thioesterase [Desulfotomaculum defluvii]